MFKPKLNSHHGLSSMGNYKSHSFYKSNGMGITGMGGLGGMGMAKPPAHKPLPQFQYGGGFGKPPSRGRTTSSSGIDFKVGGFLAADGNACVRFSPVDVWLNSRPTLHCVLATPPLVVSPNSVDASGVCVPATVCSCSNSSLPELILCSAARSEFAKLGNFCDICS